MQFSTIDSRFQTHQSTSPRRRKKKIAGQRNLILKIFDPQTAVAIIAMKYAFDGTALDLISTKEAYSYETIADAEYAEGLNDGLSQGKTEGELHKAHEMAKAMLAEGIPTEIIVRISGLSEAEFLAL